MSDRRSSWLLAGGAVIGAALAAASLVRANPTSEALPDGAVATVDGRPILRADYDRALAALAADRRAPLTAEDRARVLSRMIDEELLVGRALELGLAARDRRVRNDLSAAMLEVVRSSADDEAPDEAELRAFFATHRDRFRAAPRFTLAHAFFRDGRDGRAGAQARAQHAVETGEPSGGDDFGLPVPGGPMPMSAVVRLFGATVARGVSELSPGEVGGPWRARGGYHVVLLVAREDGAAPAFDEVADLVRVEHARARAEERLEAMLEEARQSATVVIGEAAR